MGYSPFLFTALRQLITGVATGIFIRFLIKECAEKP
jgi:hypothetical protein